MKKTKKAVVQSESSWKAVFLKFVSICKLINYPYATLFLCFVKILEKYF